MKGLDIITGASAFWISMLWVLNVFYCFCTVALSRYLGIDLTVGEKSLALDHVIFAALSDHGTVKKKSSNMHGIFCYTLSLDAGVYLILFV